MAAGDALCWRMDNKIPPLVKDFIRNAAPAGDHSPLRDLQNRYNEREGELRHAGSGLGPMPGRDSPDYLVELRIREWMMRVQKEAEEEKRLKELRERLNRQHGPNKPPNRGPGNKISPS